MPPRRDAATIERRLARRIRLTSACARRSLRAASQASVALPWPQASRASEEFLFRMSMSRPNAPALTLAARLRSDLSRPAAQASVDDVRFRPHRPTGSARRWARRDTCCRPSPSVVAPPSPGPCRGPDASTPSGGLRPPQRVIARRLVRLSASTSATSSSIAPTMVQVLPMWNSPMWKASSWPRPPAPTTPSIAAARMLFSQR